MDLYREGLVHAAERLIQAEAECRRFAEIMMREKQEKVVNKCLGKVFKCDDIFIKEQWRTENFKGRETKCIGVSFSVYHNMYDTLTDQHYEWQPKMANMTLHFLCDPDEYLNSKKKLTEKERSLLKEMRGCYECRNNNRLSDKAEKLSNELDGLKNSIYMYNDLTWSFSLDRLLADDFLSSSLWSNRTRIY